MTEVFAFLILVAFVAVVGIGLGMLVAPRITRWTERDDEPDEEQRDDGSG
jgi:hypothetical protein